MYQRIGSLFLCPKTGDHKDILKPAVCSTASQRSDTHIYTHTHSKERLVKDRCHMETYINSEANTHSALSRNRWILRNWVWSKVKHKRDSSKSWKKKKQRPFRDGCQSMHFSGGDFSVTLSYIITPASVVLLHCHSWHSLVASWDGKVWIHDMNLDILLTFCF